MTEFRVLIAQLTLPDLSCRSPPPRCRESQAVSPFLVVTWKLGNSPAEALRIMFRAESGRFPHGPLHVAARSTTAVVENARQNLKKTAPIVTKFIDALDRQKLIWFVALLAAAAGPKVIVQERRAVGGDRGIPSGFRNSVAA